MINWMVWKSRNELIWNQHSLSCSEVVESTVSVLKQWRSVQDRSFDPFMGHMSQDDGDERWSVPLINSVKINSNAAIFDESNCFSYALVARDHEGELLEARSKCSTGKPNLDMAETIAIREKLSWVKESNYDSAVVETDCLLIVQAIRSSFMCLSYLGRVVEDCRVLLASLEAKNIKFRFVKRSANKVAHHLARYSCSVADRIWRVGDVHPEFSYVLSKDLST